MRHVISTSAIALTMLCVVARSPASAQYAFESAYAPPAQMIDGVNIGARIGSSQSDRAAIGPASHQCHGSRQNCELRRSTW